MAELVVMYKTPKDAAAFDKHYFEKHGDVRAFATGGADVILYDTRDV